MTYSISTCPVRGIIISSSNHELSIAPNVDGRGVYWRLKSSYRGEGGVGDSREVAEVCMIGLARQWRETGFPAGGSWVRAVAAALTRAGLTCNPVLVDRLDEPTEGQKPETA